ncbi:MAG: RES domain-containing protein [Desulfovermiculus sp.]|nr:RES domain-containing protein [Desulfovermiculus sp.]
MHELHGWRLIHPNNLETAFTGKGSGENGGRWNHIGFPAVYTGACASVSVIEVLVHFELSDLQAIPFSIIHFTVKVPALTRIERSAMPDDWQTDPPPKTLLDMGTKWLKEAKTPVLIVPCTTVPQDDTYVLNPRHPDLDLTINRVESFSYDPRITGKNEV